MRAAGMGGAGRFASMGVGVTTKTATYTATTSDYTVRCNAAAGVMSVNLPAAASCAGSLMAIKKIDATANAVTIDPAGAETIDGAATLAMSTQYGCTVIQSNGVSWDVISAI